MISSQDLKFYPINLMLPPCLHLVIIMPILNLFLSLGPFSPFILFPMWKSSIFYILPHSQASLGTVIPLSWKNFASLQLISGKQNKGLLALSFYSCLVLAVTTVCEPSKH